MSFPERQVAMLADIQEPGAREFRVGEGDWPFRGFVVRWDGQVHAFVNSCAHAGHPLNIDPDKFFSPEKALLLCTSHGAEFEPDTGICVGGPCMGARLTALKCRVEDEKVFVRAPTSMRDLG
ncbi:MAG: Rieske (2Fe-2S) protein [Gammaproteobacteria bacterium]|jgi:nitrite reductase/ring-hydroxylating ferredoxin subunit|nr:Rieske (2Fe-2S) protein [Gammaproteobacteria bacterium]MDP6617588.1 Rieske (2Fe-2S) protein [Gammaproteobacteria bacterium]MDP6694465.1 Rieske (2Fe-2S) protein [Gammaproteobacteria bacterium]